MVGNWRIMMNEPRNLYFIRSNGKYKLLHKNVREEEVFKLIKSFLDERNYTSYYIRTWNVDNGTTYDFGSHTEFFLWGKRKE